MKDELKRISSRIEELEIRYMHQQAWIDDLNQVVREQSDQLEYLQTELIRLKGSLAESAAEEKPPHY